MKQINPSGSPVKTVYALLRRYPFAHVFPITPGQKSPPCFARNLELASNDLEDVAEWSRLNPGCNWGLALARSSMIVPDVDTRDGKRGRTTLGELELEHGPLPRTLTVRTPSGGLHYYFHEANGVKHQMRVSAFGPDIDSTNYVVLPGGRLSTGRYQVIFNLPIADAPAWFAEYLDAPIIGHNDSDQAPAVDQDTPDLIAWAIYYLKHDAPPSIQGRNGEYSLLMVAAQLKDHGISEQMAVELLAEFYNVPGRCEPQWSVYEGPIEDRLDVKVHNAWEYLKQTQPGAHTAQAEFGDDVPDIYETEADKQIGQRNHVESVFKRVYGRNLKRRRS